MLARRTNTGDSQFDVRTRPGISGGVLPIDQVATMLRWHRRTDRSDKLAERVQQHQEERKTQTRQKKRQPARHQDGRWNEEPGNQSAIISRQPVLTFGATAPVPSTLITWSGGELADDHAGCSPAMSRAATIG